jgi:5-methylcytosine-specific restriction endonuclease McrA
MNVAACQRCKRTTLRITDFEKRKDGALKGWCMRCCRGRSKVLTKMHQHRKVKKAKRQYDGTNYTSRNNNLSFLGFSSYRDYLASELWDSIRFRVFMEKGTACTVCKMPASQVHHNRYSIDDLDGSTIEELHPICGNCHGDIEFRSKDRKKLFLGQAKMKFINRRKEHLAKA